jgi:hypothetical protein
MSGSQVYSERVRNTLHPPGFDHRILQPIASGYTNYVNPARIATNRIWKIVKQRNNELEITWTQSVSINYGCLSPRTKENHTLFSRYNSCPSIDWNRVPSELIREFHCLCHLD